MDVTELKEREAALEEEAREKRQAMANEAAAKEANRLKSQFLANVSWRAFHCASLHIVGEEERSNVF